ncbi:hypothetical protein OO012_02325 [Rhodobacteraceae bacterium KMM 6894]|nr:hypothetical protein [Rhodobacteraceae bacterium KMM 6894]
MLPDNRDRQKPIPPSNHALAGTSPGKAVPGQDVTPDPIPAEDPIPDTPPGDPKDPGKPIKAGDQDAPNPPGDAEWTRSAMETHRTRPSFDGPVDPLRKAQADNLKK